MLWKRWKICAQLNNHKEELFLDQLCHIEGTIPDEDDRYPTIISPNRGMSWIRALIVYVKLSKLGIYSIVYRSEEPVDPKVRHRTIAGGLAVVLAVLAVLYFGVFASLREYNNALGMLRAGKYTEAIEAFEKLCDYRDSKERIIQAKAGRLYDAGEKARAYELYLSIDQKYNDHKDDFERVYRQAEKQLAEKQYKLAKDSFESLGSYKDSKNRIKQVEAERLFNAGYLAEAYDIYLTIDSKYNLHQSDYEKEYKEAIKLLERKEISKAFEKYHSLGEYNSGKGEFLKMAVNLVEECEKAKDYAIAQELYIQLGMKTKAQEAGVKLEKEKKYQEAVALMNAGSYLLASKEFYKLGDYEDSKALADKCQYNYAKDLMDQKNYDMAEWYFAELGEYQDSIVLSKECLYLQAGQLKEEGKFEEAEKLYAELGDYAESQSLLVEVKKLRAESCINNLQYEEALWIYISLGDIEKTHETKYLIAEKQYRDGLLKEAVNSFAELQKYDYKDAAQRAMSIKQEYISKSRRDLAFAIGNTIVFGKYEQDEKKENGLEPLEWVIIGKTDSAIFVTTKYAIECRKYNNEKVDVAWENSDIRYWLNNNFFYYAFSKEERESIRKTAVSNTEKDGKYITDPGKNTSDKIYLLSYYEAENYFKTDEERKLVSTVYASENGAHEPFCYWMLRSPGKNGNEIMAVKNGGQLDHSTPVTDDHLGVRPAMWLDLNGDAMKQIILKEGSIVAFGYYSDLDRPLRWRVIDNKGDALLLLAEKIVDYKQFNSENMLLSWKDSGLRKWLNNEFLNISFTAEEKNMLLSMDVKISSKDGVEGYRLVDDVWVKDKATLLSYRQLTDLFAEKQGRRMKATEFAKKNGTGGEYVEYWLLSPGKDDKGMTVIDQNGEPQNRWVADKKGVLPVIMLSLSFGLE